MTEYSEQRFTGERALFNSTDLKINDCIFADGESPLKESHHLDVFETSFQWKYPFWYCTDVTVNKSSFFEMARAGIWYTKRLSMTDIVYEAPKGIRRCEDVTLKNVEFVDAAETLWFNKNIHMENVVAKGTYFGMGSENIYADHFRLVGDYSFDGCKNLELHNALMLSKDAFWNCENVTVYDSYICGEYFGWNSKNVKLVNCTIESLQGFCYMDGVVLENCKLLNTTLAFEYSKVEADVTTAIESVINPAEGSIRAKEIRELILDSKQIDPSKTIITTVQ